ncbi:DNA-binding MarR family transcriptional regulator [Actinoalloteichus hoggarensis]|uniref:Transcriptional repressor AdcR n=1 Tax=Actinoalloteichus hoggarensis TaxID=1470176 RepID=A0A221W320_9PSEU|nr:MarR family transcriptional regulator [Actinoalloteichus hoggarensis]ASO20178.1 Transcriptional repressor AdcR [Actinoalloteichus hoggarensis]MBB5919109.1 DNA-binding MarR family transcriptional regulator [Actinoalloteichus hoggarensis]
MHDETDEVCAVTASMLGIEQGPVSSAIVRVARAHKLLAGSLLTRLGLYPGQEIVLMLLAESGSTSQRDLVNRLGIHPSTVTKTVQRLERAGFICRTRSSRDARVMLVELTEAGSGLLDRLHGVWAELEEQTVAGLSGAERAELLSLLERLERSISTAPAARPSVARSG